MENNVPTAKSWLTQAIRDAEALQRVADNIKDIISKIPSVTQAEMDELDTLWEKFDDLTGEESKPIESEIFMDLAALAERSGVKSRPKAERETAEALS